jgi:hypothetical protein
MKSNQNRGPEVAMDSAIGTSCPQVIFGTGVRAMISMFVFLFPFVVNAAELQQQTVKALGRVRPGRPLPHAAAASTRRPLFLDRREAGLEQLDP